MTLLSVLLFGVLLLCGAHTVFGCSCAPSPPHRQLLYCNNDIVFIGKIREVLPAASMDDDHIYHVKVRRVFKGNISGVITVKTPNNGGMCGITGLVKKEKYLMTAKSNNDGTYQIQLCQSLILNKNSVTNEVKRKYNSNRRYSFPGLNDINCKTCKIVYCGESKDGCGSNRPTTCTYYGDYTKIQCFNKLRCIPSASGKSCRWSSPVCGRPGDITIG
ncbi:metalloproteinase inhibitor 1-like [Mizuhopecten yessoensis]|uniref:Metalloproteinase inhibitor 2 n=1 Tax=Mizuhopecten yessoensis TaxID=6573 RepID=A0A210PHX3_MIZYE|nr:metalloproteinase inhibitor 1-like [Mizuhopecten yessoensis]OWF36085.1 Metalloproteinase inhibitor 2 [Mizuhopecten yessoensis]